MGDAVTSVKPVLYRLQILLFTYLLTAVFEGGQAEQVDVGNRLGTVRQRDYFTGPRCWCTEAVVNMHAIRWIHEYMNNIWIRMTRPRRECIRTDRMECSGRPMSVFYGWLCAGDRFLDRRQSLLDYTCQSIRFRFRFNSIVARKLNITKITANRAKSNKAKYNRQQDNTIQSYSRLQCSPVGLFWVATRPRKVKRKTSNLSQDAVLLGVFLFL